MDETLAVYAALDRTHPQIVDDLLKECGDELAQKVIAASKVEAITDQRRIDLLVTALTKAEHERDSLREKIHATSKRWLAEAADALPVDAMLITKKIRELLQVVGGAV